MARPRLARSLDQAWTRRLTLVTAPAGYGKSVALSQWHRATRPGPIAWLVLDERDRDPVRMGHHLLRCLAGVDADLGRRAWGLLGSPAAGLGDEVIDILIEDFASLTEPAVVVLEDLDHLDDGPIVDDLSRLVIEAPPPVHYVVSSRRDPALPTHRLRVNDQLVEIRADDLRFSADEAAAVVRLLSDHDLGRDTADHLVQLTEGWPVAVQLAALSLRGADDASAITRFDAADHGIVDYLSAEVLGRLAPEQRAFLLDVSVLHELHPGLCDHVTGRHGSAELLAELRRRSLFVVPAGGDSGQYRIHRLVRAFLRHDLDVAEPDRAAELQELAAAWCLDRGDPGQAAEYLIGARSWERLVALVYDNGRDLWDRGQIDAVLGWLRAIPQSVLSEHVRLDVTEAALHLLAGRAESCAARLAAVERHGDLTPGEQLVTDVVTCSLVEVTTPAPDALARQERSLAALAELSAADIPDVLHVSDPVSLRCDLQFTGAKTRLLLGVAGALDDAEAAALSPPSVAAIFLVQAHGTQALIEALANRGRAETSARRALALASDHLADEHPALIPAETALAVAARNRDDLDAADAYAGAALARAVRWRRWPIVALIYAERALLELARGAPEAALSWIGRYTTLHDHPLTPTVAGRFLAVERRAGAALGDGEPRAGGDGATVSWELALTDVALAVEGGDPAQARKVLDAWPTACSPLGDDERELATALVERAEGAAAAARSRVTALLASTGRDGLVVPFTSAGAAAIPLVAEVADEGSGPHADRVLAATRRAAGNSPELPNPLSTRELELLRLLPSRLSNAEIGRALFVSTNTVKTHLKHIYQKLAVADRDGAIQRARELRLLSVTRQP